MNLNSLSINYDHFRACNQKIFDCPVGVWIIELLYGPLLWYYHGHLLLTNITVVDICPYIAHKWLDWRYTIWKCMTILTLENLAEFGRILVDQTTEEIVNKDTQKGFSLNADFWVKKRLPPESGANGSSPDIRWCSCGSWATRDAKKSIVGATNCPARITLS